MKKMLLTLVLLGLAAAAQAEVRYVDDKLLVSLRAGQGNNFRIVSTVESGTRLEVLEINGDYFRVRDPKGNEGWVRDQYLTTEPAARDRLTHAEQKIAALEADKQKLRSQISTMEGERREVRKGQTELEKENQKLVQEMAQLRESAANPLKLANENRVMRDQLDALEQEAQHLRTDNARLQDDTARGWVLTGAGILLSGMLVGMYIHKLRRRRSSWSSDF